MAKSTKIIMIVVSILVIVCISVTLIITKNHDSSDIEHIYLSEVLIYKDGNEYEVLVDKENKYTCFRFNEEREVYYKYPREGKSRLQIPNFEKVNGEDTISRLKPLSNYTYSVDFDGGCAYVKYLMDSGYEMKMYVVTSSYFECFLLKDGVYKRVAIFKDSMMACDMIASAELPDINSYLISYDFNDFLSQKLNEKKQTELED